MSRVRAILGYFWAILALPIILATFIGNGFWAEKLVTATGLKVSPWLSGGEVQQTIHHQQYQTLIHQAVFQDLLWQRSRGFIQIDWQPQKGVLPEVIDEAIDYDQDGNADFRIQLNTQTDTAKLIILNYHVMGIEHIYKVENERIVRIGLRNKL
jgi:thiol:disulfide interchange protein